MVIIFEKAPPGGDEFDDYYEEWDKLINDTNPGSQEKALFAC